MAEKNGGSAFPQIETDEESGHSNTYGRTYSYGGMTLRDWFAGQIAIGLCASLPSLEVPSLETFSRAVYAAADAMLAEREK